jgi:hypothetical protein
MSTPLWLFVLKRSVSLAIFFFGFLLSVYLCQLDAFPLPQLYL